LKKVVVIDNYDSFVYNIIQHVGEVEPNSEIKVFRNDKTTIEKIENLNPTHIIISPGPGRPENAGITVDIVKNFSGKIPILGVCLGHQAIGYAFGGKIVHAKRILHGKTSKIFHNEQGIFRNVKNPLIATRYHSLVVSNEKFPEDLIITAKSDDEEIMAVQHKSNLIFGVQFHPESILTFEGKKIIKNFLNIEKSLQKTEKKPKEEIIKVIEKLLKGENLTFEEARDVMEEIMSGKVTDVQISGFLVALRIKGETGEELGGMARTMQERSIKVRISNPKTVDTCGTGGDGAGTFNISTATAFVVSAGGISVAKHGNRSVSSKVGSADVLEAGGYKLKKEPEELEKELAATGFTFLFAPFLHPAMKYVMPARRQLKVRTVFNLLGPITNPARVKYQIVGVFNFDFASKLAVALQKLGTVKSIVLSGGFTDELTTCGDNKAILVTQKEITPFEVDIKKLRLKKGNIEELKGPNNSHDAYKFIEKVLKGKGTRTQIETVALNAGLMFWIVDETDTIEDGVEKALDLIVSGRAYVKLKEVMEYQQTMGNH